MAVILSAARNPWAFRDGGVARRGEPGYTPRALTGGLTLEAHGGYLIRIESFHGLELVRLAREALALDGVSGVLPSLHVTVIRRRKVVRLAFTGPHAAGRQDARWYADHHALARMLSRAANATVHVYVYDPEEREQVIAYGNGHRVGGDQVVYEDVELSGEEEEDDAAFKRMRARWPMGHLAYVFGLTREELLGMPRSSPAVVLTLDAMAAQDEQERLKVLLPGPQLSRGPQRSRASDAA
jgi:hypothetical protein